MSRTGVWTLATGTPSVPEPSEEHVQLRICGFWSRDHLILYVVLFVCVLDVRMDVKLCVALTRLTYWKGFR